MAPNNALRANVKSRRPTGVATRTMSPATPVPVSTNSSQTLPSNGERTTVLDEGIVESRGTGVALPVATTPSGDGCCSRQVVSDEIERFLRGEGRMSPYAEMRALFTVWTFVTRLPGPTWVDHHPGYLMRGMAYFPLAGSIIGLLVATCFDFARTGLNLPPAVSAAASMASSFWVTGCFHEDGLADASDGIGGGWSRSQILRIMTDTRLGTYGCAVLLLYVVAKIELLAAMDSSTWDLCFPLLFVGKDHNVDNDKPWPWWWFVRLGQGGRCSGAGPALLVSNSLSRLISAYMIRTRDYVDEGGAKYQFYSFMIQAKHLVSWHRVAFATATSLFVAASAYGWTTASTLVTSVLIGGHLAGSYGEYLLGGVMGDFLGASICVADVLVLTLVLSKDDAAAVIKEARNAVAEWMQARTGSSSSPSPSSLSLALLTNERLAALVRFALVAAATALWCRCVGHPDVLVREAAVANAERDDDDDDDDDDNERVRIGTTSAGPGRDASGSTPISAAPDRNGGGESFNAEGRSAAERICSSTSSSFAERYDAIRTYIDALAKPVGSLGTLEDWSARLGALQRTTQPRADRISCLIFAADHGMAASIDDGGEECSAYPQGVTRSVLEALDRGLAGASVLAEANGVDLRVVDVGVVVRGGENDGGKGAGEDAGPATVVVTSVLKLVGGTRNACSAPAMSVDEAGMCVLAGRRAFDNLVRDRFCQVVVLGEAGIGNTTSASALVAALTGGGEDNVEAVCGGGATVGRDVDDSAVQKKVRIVKKALALHDARPGLSLQDDPSGALAKVGGAEIAALVGSILEASERDIPVVVDGFIVTAAALVAAKLSPACCRVMLFATRSTEPGQAVALNAIMEVLEAASKEEGENRFGIPKPAPPALSMGLRMGEATGGLMAAPLVRSACAVLSNMATIQDIVGDKTPSKC